MMLGRESKRNMSTPKRAAPLSRQLDIATPPVSANQIGTFRLFFTLLSVKLV